MRINIYQINPMTDENRVKFLSYGETITKSGGHISPDAYKCVFHGDVDGDLEDAYTVFNCENRPGTFQGHSLSVSDIIEVTKGTDYTPCGCYFVDAAGFVKLDNFDTSLCHEMDGLRMLMIQPRKAPVVTYVKNELEDLQRAVSDHGEPSLIEITAPFGGDCLVLGNENAKLIGMPGNRVISGEIYAGPLFISRKNPSSGELISLTDKQVDKFSHLFAYPEFIPQDEVERDIGFKFIAF